MDFDFRHVAVPFRMQPGLQRLAPATPQGMGAAPPAGMSAGPTAAAPAHDDPDAGASTLSLPHEHALARALGRGAESDAILRDTLEALLERFGL